MCGIVGYIGYREASPVLLNSLKKLEYRGYDSCGIAVRNGSVLVYKNIGSVDELSQSIHPTFATSGIGHTRWATHGKPCRENAHPHTDTSGNIAVVHNGIISNSQQLKSQLLKEGFVFASETDTETIPHLISKYYTDHLDVALRHTLKELKGSYAIVALCKDDDCLVATRKESPLVIGVGEREWFVASDVTAVLDYTDRVIYLEDGDIATLTRGSLRISNNEIEVTREICKIPWKTMDMSKAGYAHYMLKEIHEQPKAIQKTLDEHLMSPEFDSVAGMFVKTQNTVILGCGSSYYAGLVGRRLLEELAGIPAIARLSTDFYYKKPVNSDSVVVGITQSGETADTLNGLRSAITQGFKTVAITNAPGSSVTRLADDVIYTKAGPEIGVAATKTFTTQLVTLYLLALALQKSNAAKQDIIAELRQIPGKIHQLLSEEEKIARTGRYLAGFDFATYIAGGINTPIAMEGALKLKEIAYIHADGYSAGELKHGPFALLTPKTPVIAIASGDETYDSLLSTIKEIKAREAPVIAIAGEDDEVIDSFVDSVIRVPRVNPLLSPIINTVVVQLLAYYAALERGCSIDKPRNLAKSVTVV
jgi:glucosamine--fructose-6-phosphate aminotransferase (isomerizing)